MDIICTPQFSLGMGDVGGGVKWNEEWNISHVCICFCSCFLYFYTLGVIICTSLFFCSFDELIVGAPMYSSIFSPETGRVYVFENIEVRYKLEQVFSKIQGTITYNMNQVEM